MQIQPKIVLGITLAKPGGATSFVFGFGRWLKQHGYNPTILAGEGDWLFEQCKQEGIECIRVPALEREISWKDLPAFFQLWHLFRKLKPDVVHLNSTKMGAAGSIAARCAHVPRIIYCIGGWVFLEDLSETKKRIYTLIERWSAPFKDTIICLHQKDVEAAHVRHIKPQQEILTIANGIDLPHIDSHLKTREDARQLLGLPKTGYIFGTIGHFYPAKDLPRYISSCAHVHAQHPDALFVLVGDGMERPIIEQKIREHHLEKHVLLLGSQERAWQYLRAFDAFVLPSTKEGMPFTLLEAMAASLPCIVTDVGANKWMLEEDGGWVVPPKSPNELANAMMEALQNPQRARARGVRAREIVEQRFPLEKTYQAHLATILRQPTKAR